MEMEWEFIKKYQLRKQDTFKSYKKITEALLGLLGCDPYYQALSVSCEWILREGNGKISCFVSFGRKISES